MAEQAAPLDQLGEIIRRFRSLLQLRAALAPFRVTLRVLREGGGPEGRGELAALWRPCQEQFDLLPDAGMVHIRLLRQEIEDSLLDEVVNLAALEDGVDSLDQACEAALLEIERDLQEAVTELERIDRERSE